MASQEDTDDLYADLYGGDGSGTGDVVDLGGDDKAGDEQDLIGYDDEDNKADDNNDNKASGDNGDASNTTSGAPSGGSFIPPASSTGQEQQSGSGLQIKGSFIPPAANNPPVSSNQAHGDVRDLTPATHNDAQGGDAQEHQNQQQGANEGAGHGGSDNRSIMPHEMPEEAKMFVGGLNWDTTEDSLRRYFSQFGEVGHCTIMRDNATGRSRGFAFLNFVDPKAVNTVMVREHYLDGKVIDPKRAIPRPQQNNYNHGGNNHGGFNGGGGQGGGNFSSGSQKLFVGGLPPSVTPQSFRIFFEQYGPLAECTCMMDRETGNPRGFGFLTYQDGSALQTVLNTRPIVFDGKEVDVKRAQSKNDPQSLQARRAQGLTDPSGMQQGGGGYGMGTGSNRFNNNNNNNNNNFGNNNNGGWGMNPMMMGMMGQGGGAGGQGGFDQNAMAQMYQSMGWGNQNWNPQMAAWQQMMASMTGQQGGAAGAGGMDMGAMMNSMGMGGMGGMGMMGGMGSMSPPTATSMSPTLGAGTVNNAQRGSSNGPSGGNDREPPSGPRGGNGPSNSRFQRGGSHNAGGSRPPPTGPSGYNGGSRDDRERSPNHRRERSPNRQGGGERRYDNNNNNRNRY